MKFLSTVTALVLSASATSAATIEFSSNQGSALGHSDIINGAFDFGGITGTISTQRNAGNRSDPHYVEGRAQIFDTSLSNTRDPDLEFPNDDLGNVLIVAEGSREADDNWSGGIITFVFDQLINFEGVTLVDLERNQPVYITTDSTGFGPLSNGDNQFSFFDAPPSGPTNTLSFLLTGSGAIDNLTVSEVPLPFSGLLLLGGLGALGLQRRKKA